MSRPTVTRNFLDAREPPRSSRSAAEPQYDRAVAAVGPYARLAIAAFAALFMLAVVAEFLTAGFGLFGATSLDLHEDLGPVTLVLAILIFLASLFARVGRNGLALGFLIGALTVIQVLLPTSDNRWVAGLHPVNALVLFLLAHALLRRARAAGDRQPGRASRE